MIEVLEGEGPFTVFAPVDEAFGQLPPAVLEWLLAEENGNVLETIIQSHIVPGAALLAQDLLDHEVELETLGGAMLAVGGTAGVILVLPLEATITEVNERAEPQGEAIPASAIVVEAPQDAVAGAELSMVAGQELTAFASMGRPSRCPHAFPAPRRPQANDHSRPGNGAAAEAAPR